MNRSLARMPAERLAWIAAAVLCFAVGGVLANLPGTLTLEQALGSLFPEVDPGEATLLLRGLWVLLFVGLPVALGLLLERLARAQALNLRLYWIMVCLAAITLSSAIHVENQLRPPTGRRGEHIHGGIR